MPTRRSPKKKRAKALGGSKPGIPTLESMYHLSSNETDYRVGTSNPKLRDELSTIVWDGWTGMPQTLLVRLPESPLDTYIIQIKIGQTVLTVDFSKAGEIRFVQEKTWSKPTKSQPPKKSRPRKHVAPPASADEIRRNLDVSPQETSQVHQVLSKLGYVKY